MSYTRVKTTFEQEGGYGSTDTIEIYCLHDNSRDITIFYYADGTVVDMVFQEWSSGKNKWDAVAKLMLPFKDDNYEELQDGVEYYTYAPWEKKSIK